MKSQTLLAAAGLSALIAGAAMAQSTTPSSPSNPTPGVTSPGATTAPGSTTSGSTTSGSTTSGATTPTSPNAATSGTTTQGNPNATTSTTTAPATTGSLTGMWYTAPISANQHRASDLINQSVYNRANERVGEVNELVLDQNGQVVAAIVGVGGFLGIGERNVAVNFSQLQMMTDNNTMRIVINADKNQLQQAPEFRRPDTWRRL